MLDFLFSSWFWIFIFIIMASGLILKGAFKLRLSLFPLFLLIVFIFFLFNLFNNSDNSSKTSFFYNGTVKIDDLKETDQYNCAFCQVTYDFTLTEQISGEPKEIVIKSLFCNKKIIINKNQKIKVEAKAFFASVNTPDKIKTIAGNQVYFTSRYSKNNPHLLLSVHSFFSKTEIFEK